MTLEITPVEMLAQLRTIAEKKMAENGGVDYVYRKRLNARHSCLYVEQTEMGLQPSCIVGHWLHQDQGVALGDFESSEGDRASVALARFGIGEALSVLEAVPNSAVQNIANHVQNLQDEGIGWVEAVEMTEAWVDSGYRYPTNSPF